MAMIENLKLSLIQADLKWEDKKANLQHFESIIRTLEGTDIIILPEMFSTGFSMKPERYYEEMNGEIIGWMKAISHEKNAAVCGSMIIKDGSLYFNRFIFVADNMVIAQYDKRHLFRMGEENEHYTRGSDRVVFEYRGWRIMPQICYDLRFPVWYRNRNDYHLLINVANWPAVRSRVWTTLLKARALENQCYVAGVNRVGEDANGLGHSGNSMLVDYKGDVIEFRGNEPGVVHAEIYLSKLNEFKSKFPAFLDSDNFKLIP